MTFKQKLMLEHPDKIRTYGNETTCVGCPCDYGYEFDAKNCPKDNYGIVMMCKECWDREMPEKNLVDSAAKKLSEGLKNVGEKAADAAKKLAEATKAVDDSTPHILDSGNRREFETGAVRDICEGKGRCDLLPLDMVALYLSYKIDCLIDPGAQRVFERIHHFQKTDDLDHLFKALDYSGIFNNMYTMFLEVAKHFEEGCKKYGDNNWQKGIPTHCYIDSAVRHYLKYLRGDKDEPHDRAFCWNILCCIWTCIHKPELNDYRKETTDEENH